MPLTTLSAQQEPSLRAQDERWHSIQRIVESQHFCKSARLCGLLSYLAEQTLAERTEFLTEYHIATRVFGRQNDFDPDVDTIVRSHMVRLRQKLEQYAVALPAEAAVRVTVPKGEYRVRFETTVPPPSFPVSVLPATAQTPAVASPAVASWAAGQNPLRWVCGILCVALLVLFTTLLTVLSRSHESVNASANAVAAHPLWGHFFAPYQTTTLVAADSGLVLLHRMTGKSTTLQEYLTRDFSQETHGLSPGRINEVLNVGERRYTSFVDLNLFKRLQRVASAGPGRLEVRYARDMQMNELKQGNVILSGSSGANPWLALYEPRMNFIGNDEWMHHGYTYVNRHPNPGEASTYSTSEGDPQQRVLGVLAFLPSVEGSGNTLLVEGNSMAGTEAISDFLFDDDALLPFLGKLQRRDGTVPFFEVLIEANSVNGSAGPFRILAYRTHS